MKIRPVPHRIRTERRSVDFKLDEVAKLLGCSDPSQLSRIEHAVRRPSVHVLVASIILYRRSAEELFAGLFNAIEEDVVREAMALHEKLAADPAPVAQKKCTFLSDLIYYCANPKKNIKKL